jgi:hypothetical protein
MLRWNAILSGRYVLSYGGSCCFQNTALKPRKLKVGLNVITRSVIGVAAVSYIFVCHKLFWRPIRHMENLNVYLKFCLECQGISYLNYLRMILRKPNCMHI